MMLMLVSIVTEWLWRSMMYMTSDEYVDNDGDS